MCTSCNFESARSCMTTFYQVKLLDFSIYLGTFIYNESTRSFIGSSCIASYYIFLDIFKYVHFYNFVLFMHFIDRVIELIYNFKMDL